MPIVNIGYSAKVSHRPEGLREICFVCTTAGGFCDVKLELFIRARNQIDFSCGRRRTAIAAEQLSQVADFRRDCKLCARNAREILAQAAATKNGLDLYALRGYFEFYNILYCFVIKIPLFTVLTKRRKNDIIKS